MHLRVAFLIFEDLPQLIILMRYFVALDSNTGVACSDCVGNNDGLCETRRENRKTVLAVR
jgi:hypothetical protein